MALITVHRSPSGSPHSTPTGLKDEERNRRSRMQRRRSFVMVKGAALLLQEEEEPDSIQSIPPPSLGHKRTRSAQTQDQQQRCHLQAMVSLLRPQDDIKLVVRLESVKSYRIRYLLVVSTLGSYGEDETILLGVNFPSDGCSECTIGLVLPLWSNTQVFLDGDGFWISQKRRKTEYENLPSYPPNSRRQTKQQYLQESDKSHNVNASITALGVELQASSHFTKEMSPISLEARHHLAMQTLADHQA